MMACSDGNVSRQNPSRLKRWITWLTLVTLLGGCAGSRTYRSSVMRNQARFTITLGNYRQSSHQQTSRDFLNRAKAVLPESELWLEHHNDQTLVNYGYFDTSERYSAIQRQLTCLKNMVEQIKPDPYQFFYIRPLEIPDPPMPSSWHLTHASCDYTLEVATFYDDPKRNYYNRKQDALNLVRTLRKEHHNAWLIHGTYESRVYVGCIRKSQFRKDAQGHLDINSSATARELLVTFQFRYENGMEVYTVSINNKGQKRRLPVMPSLVRLRNIKRGINF